MRTLGFLHSQNPHCLKQPRRRCLLNVVIVSSGYLGFRGGKLPNLTGFVLPAVIVGAPRHSGQSTDKSLWFASFASQSSRN